MAEFCLDGIQYPSLEPYSTPACHVRLLFHPRHSHPCRAHACVGLAVRLPQNLSRQWSWCYRLVVVWLLPFSPSLSLLTSIDRSRLQIRVFLVRRMLKMGAGFRLFHSWYSSSKKNMHGSSKHSWISCDSVAVDGTRFGPVLVSRARLDLIC